MTNSTEDAAKVSTPPSFSKGANAGATGSTPPEQANYPLERSSCMGSSKQPAYGSKTYKEYGAPSPKIPGSSV